MNRARRAPAVALSAFALLGGLTACSSKPGNRRVVSDVIESLQLADAQERCMLDRLDVYSDDELDQIAADNEKWDPSSGSSIEDASDGMRAFIADFESCTTEGATPTSSSEPAATDSTETTDG